MQIELHPYAQRVEWREKARQFGIQMECWFPLGGEMSNGLLPRLDDQHRADAYLGFLRFPFPSLPRG